MTYNAAIPQANDILSDSQVALLTNFGALNISFGIDHYTFNDLTANNGFHKVVHTPSQASSPSTHPATTTNPIFYAAMDNVNLPGPLQYSKGSNNAVQGPITTLQSSAAGLSASSGSPQAVFNFNAMMPTMPYCYGTLIWAGTSSNASAPIAGMALIFWNGSSGITTNIAVAQTVETQFSGSTLQIATGSFGISSLSWTLQFSRIFTPT